MMWLIDMYGEYAADCYKRKRQSSSRNIFDSYNQEEREDKQWLDGKSEKKE